MYTPQPIPTPEVTYLPNPEHQSESHTSTIYALTSTPRYIISGSKDHSIRIWSKQTQHLAFPPLLAHVGAVVAIEASDAPELIFSGDGKGNVMIWDLTTGALAQNMENAHTDTVLGVAFKGRVLVTASRDQSVKVWEGGPDDDAENEFNAFRLRHTLLGHQGAVLSVCVTHDGTRAVTMSGADRAMRVWDLRSGEVLKSFEGLAGAAVKLQLIGGERKVLAACTDTGIRVFDLESGEEEVCVYGHGNVVRAVQMVGSQDESKMVSASYDSTVRLWERSDGGRGAWSTVRTFSFREAVGNFKMSADDAKRVYDVVVDETDGCIYACGEAREIVQWKLES
ncbi:WD40 repeat-like protein [Mytilinidion resinicola]|uniref:WD40 repeat-like protein n=1 Tax=Mytilinidion resinicola TaxID=574789 RepID=A0A6A6YUH0_9PEZI|nr:WD40 repeat-like protein [Mytilinidion resinicola]KAF2811615.1 WD40 repeat-like protein [Mytilinidion resinicola]